MSLLVLMVFNKTRGSLLHVNVSRGGSPTLVHMTDETCITTIDGFDVLDVCHRQTLFTLGKLAALVARLTRGGADAGACAMARAIVEFFSPPGHRQHQDGERRGF